MYWSKSKVEPSEKVSLRISVTQPRSVVGIVAVDKSTTLMNMSNDITMENVSLPSIILLFVFPNQCFESRDPLLAT